MDDTAHIPARPWLRRRGALVAALLAALVLGLIWWLAHRPPAGGAGFGGPGGPGRGGRRPPSTVGLATAVRGDVPITIEALGTVTPLATATVRTQVAGPLAEVRFREGDRVRRGDVLAVVDPRPFALALEQAQGVLARDSAQLANARVQLDRYRELLAQDSIARQDVDTQAATVAQLEGAVATDRAAVDTARLNLGYTRIAAPFDGRAGLRAVDVGNLVATSDANGITTVTQLEPIDVTFAIPADDIPAVTRRGAAAGRGNRAAPGPIRAVVLDRTRTRVLAEGEFLTLNNQIDPTTGTVRAKARFANRDEALFPNQFVNVVLRVDVLSGAVVVPTAAVRHGPQGDYVWVVTPDRTASLRPVTRGPVDGERMAVLAGVAAGEQVVTEGADRLTDGAPVQLPGARPGGAGGPPGAGPRGPHGDGSGTGGGHRWHGARGGAPAGDRAAPGAGGAAGG
jgi:multidrug efflux system membrane fusion protein